MSRKRDDDDDQVSFWRAMKELHSDQRARFGVECPQCKVVRPKACASILLPQQRCRVDGYRDPRPREVMKEDA